MVYLTRVEHFNAAHKLANPNWSKEKNEEVFGVCANENWHGHNYDLYVTVKGEVKPETGFGVATYNYNDFELSNPPMMLFIFLAGPMTVIPLFLYVRGVELCGLGATGMIFYITPTLQFILGYFYYDEPFSMEKLVSFIFIWIAVIIYLKDLHETN